MISFYNIFPSPNFGSVRIKDKKFKIQNMIFIKLWKN